MTGSYVDTTFVYAVVRGEVPAPHAATVDAWIEQTREHRPLSWSALVVDEVAYRLALGFLRDAGVADPLTAFRQDASTSMRQIRGRLADVWARLDEFGFSLLETDDAVVTRAKTLMADPGLAPRDAFHAAHALQGGCEVIVSTDADFDAVTGLRRIGPP